MIYLYSVVFAIIFGFIALVKVIYDLTKIVLRFINSKRKTDEYKDSKYAKVKEILEKEEHTIPSLCQKLGERDEFEILNIVGELESKGLITIMRFEEIYREDGGCIHLAIYGKVKNNELLQNK